MNRIPRAVYTKQADLMHHTDRVSQYCSLAY